MIVWLICFSVLYLVQIMITVIAVIGDSSDFESRCSFVLCLLIPGYPIGKAVYRGWLEIGARDEKRREKEYEQQRWAKLRKREREYQQEKIGNPMRINYD